MLPPCDGVLEDPNEESVPIELVDRLLAGGESGARLAGVSRLDGELSSLLPLELRPLICRP